MLQIQTGRHRRTLLHTKTIGGTMETPREQYTVSAKQLATLHGVTINSINKWTKDGAYLRCITPLECERLQTVPDNYTNHVSDTQRYKMLGNGWTVDIIAHILKMHDKKPYRAT
jgi:site-specific DNA-cytosine methylase